MKGHESRAIQPAVDLKLCEKCGQVFLVPSLYYEMPLYYEEQREIDTPFGIVRVAVYFCERCR